MRTLFIVLATALLTATMTLLAVEAESNPALERVLTKAVHQDHYCQAPEISNEYDSIYRASVHQFYPPRFSDDKEFCWVKSQAIAESNQDPQAISPAGAMGVLQLMPDTFDEIADRYGIQPDAHDARVNIQMGVAYQSTIFKIWYTDRTKKCHREVSNASYNAGPGNIIKAQIQAMGAPCFPEIGEKLYIVTGEKNSAETNNYLKRIDEIHSRLTY